MISSELINNLNLIKISDNESPIEINNLTWRTEESNNNSALFYFLNDGDKAIKDFEDRLKNTTYGLIVLPKMIKTTLKNVYFTEEWNSCMHDACNEFYPFDFSKLKVFGITGTNGKTTIVNICQQLALQVRKSSISIGTLGIIKNGKTVEDFSLTSPPQVDFRKAIFNHAQDVDYLFIELSSHALEQERLYGLSLDVASMCSFSQDHLDYHVSMKDYLSSKLKIKKILKNNQNFLLTYSDVDLAKKLDELGVSYSFPEKNENHKNDFLKVNFNQLNLDLAIGMFNLVNEDVTQINLNKITPAPGRFNLFKVKNNNIAIVDYAHTPVAIENVCKAAKETYNKNLVTIFGCGGNRDKSKRSLMRVAAENHSNFVLITSDNPRFEDPEEIIKDVYEGCTNQETSCITDRKEAIKTAIETHSNSVIIIAGKGHENYIIIGDKKHAYSDIDEIGRYLA